MRRQTRWALVLALCLTSIATVGLAAVHRTKFTNGSGYLIVEVLDDDLVHVEASAVGNGPTTTDPLYASPMVKKTDYTGPTSLSVSGNTIETADLVIEVDPATLALTFKDKHRANALLTKVTPEELDNDFKRLRIERGAMQHVYGLGQRFKVQGSADGDWTMLGVREGEGYGNGFMGFQSACVGNVQIPVMYAVGPNDLNFGLFFDNVYRQRWDFTAPSWEVRAFGDQLRYYVMAGPNLPDLRSDYLELTGRPPVPPRKAFGLWVSEFGYDNWDQIDALKSGLRSAHFPVDGFVLDLNWFGGVDPNNANVSRMGNLDWDTSNTDGNSYDFNDPNTNIHDLAADHVGIAAIEESYLAHTTTTFGTMPANLTVFKRIGGVCDPGDQTHVDDGLSGFWGHGRMIDWSDPEAGKYIHDHFRFPNLVANGVTVHWTDLGEPEQFDAQGCYDGVETVAGDHKNEHPDVCNLYNLFWNKSIWDGYFDKRAASNSPRPLILTRSGAAGTQRFGAAMWSGDIASNLESLATHLNAQLHMSFSGIDYYGADVGGFRREVLPYNDKQGSYRGYLAETYTQWFANACWFDVPIRPHVDNEFVKVTPSYDTSPHLVGDQSSNLSNLRQRYELTPYYYSLAYRAYLAGEPVIPPLVFYYQNDPNVRTMGHEKLIGRDLLVAAVARYGEYERDVYLPAGTWFDYHTHQKTTSSGEVKRNIPAYRDGDFQLPAFVRSGAILPKMFVDDQTLDVFGDRAAGAAPRNELVVEAYASATPTTFTLYEDDGKTLTYDAAHDPTYRYRTTELRQQQVSDNTAKVHIAPAVDVGGGGPMDGVVNVRPNVVRLIVGGKRATAVTLNGTALPEQATLAQFDAATAGWCNAGPNLILAKSVDLNVYSTSKEFVFTLTPAAAGTSVNFIGDRGFTQPGESIYVVGSIPELGSWNVASAVKLSPSVYYEYIFSPPPAHNGPGPSAPVWSGVVDNLPANTTFEWKCIRKRDDGTGSVQFEPGPNNVFTTAAQGYSGRAYGTF